MPKAHVKKAAKAKLSQAEIASLDLDQNAWPKFERLVKSAAKLGPKPHNRGKLTKG